MPRHLTAFCISMLLSSVLAPVVQAGNPLPPPDARLDNAACKAVPTAPGPHSLLALSGSSRLLVSSHDRRHFERAGTIEDYDTATRLLRQLPRTGEPADLVLRPHHMDSLTKNGETLLYVINHDDDNPNGTRHSILIYKVEPDRLVWRQRLRDPLLSSPNHISIAPDGDVYVSNDRRDGSSVMELALRMSRANIVLYREDRPEGQRWRIVADGLSFPNGVKADARQVLVAMTFGNALLTFPRNRDGSLGAARTVIHLPALDGINPGPDAGTYLVVSHGPLLDFLRHQNDSRKRSSGILYLVNAVTGKASAFFSDDGSRISAMSNAVFSQNALYIGQSFDSFLLRCPLQKT
ncbi:MAG: hypothetical protein PSX71_03340 [bacterium]|nr:hypothetical protein [bacterium]